MSYDIMEKELFKKIKNLAQPLDKHHMLKLQCIYNVQTLYNTKGGKL